MPSKRLSTRPRTGAEVLTDDQVEYLVYGYVMLDPAPADIGFQGDRDSRDWVPFASPEAVLTAWRVHRQQIIEAAREATGGAPSIWWTTEAPEPRRQLRGPAPLTELPAVDSCFCRSCTLYLGLVFGIPNAWRNYEDCAAAEFEDEDAYMERLGIDPVTLKGVVR